MQYYLRSQEGYKECVEGRSVLVKEIPELGAVKDYSVSYHSGRLFYLFLAISFHLLKHVHFVHTV